MKNYFKKLHLLLILCAGCFMLNAQSLPENENLHQQVLAIKLASKPQRALFARAEDDNVVRDGFFTTRWKKQFWLFELKENNLYTIKNVVNNEFLSSNTIEKEKLVTQKSQNTPLASMLWEVVFVEDDKFKLKPSNQEVYLTFGDFDHTETLLVEYVDDLKQVITFDKIKGYNYDTVKEVLIKPSLVSTAK